MKKTGLVIIASILFAGCTLIKQTETNLNMNNQNQSVVVATSQPSSDKASSTATQSAKMAVLKTSLGDISVELYSDKVPVTVANFVALSEGTVDWVDPRTGQKQTGVPYFKDIIFHRVIKDFMIQGGDITGTGMGGPGYRFKDEFDQSLVFDEPGILAMANSGPNTNGAQFFITTVATPWLNGKHTIFGKVVKGMDVVKKIEAVETGANDKPKVDVLLKEVVIER